MSKCQYFAANGNLSKTHLKLESLDSKMSPVMYIATTIPHFTNWFGDSKAADNNYDPVVFHVKEDFDVDTSNDYVEAYVYSPNKTGTEGHVYLSAQNPIYSSVEPSRETIAQAFSQGYDSVMVAPQRGEKGIMLTDMELPVAKVIMNDTRKVRAIGPPTLRYEGLYDFHYMEVKGKHEQATLVRKMEEAFAAAGVAVTTRLDPTATEAYIERQGDTNVIILPMDAFSNADIYHEFGHLYLDLLGYDHPAVQAAIAELRDTPLWQEIAGKYPELAHPEVYLDSSLYETAEEYEAALDNARRTFHKEVVAHAIEKHALQNEQAPTQGLVYWLREIIRQLAQKLGIKTSASKLLARELLRRQFVLNNQRLFVDQRYYRRRSSVNRADTFWQEAEESRQNLDQKMRVYNAKLTEATSNEQVRQWTTELKSTLNSLENMILEKKEVGVVITLADRIKDDVTNAYSILEQIELSINKNPNYYPNPGEIEYVSDVIEGYMEMSQELLAYIRQVNDAAINNEQDQVFPDYLQDDLQRAVNRLDSIERMREAQVYRIISRELLPQAKQRALYRKRNEWRREFKERNLNNAKYKKGLLGVDFKKLDDDANAYANEQTALMTEEELSEQAQVFIDHIMDTSDHDLNKLQIELTAPNMITEPMVAGLYNIITQAHDRVRLETIDRQRVLKALNDEFVKVYGRQDMRQRYSYMMSDDGRYYVTQYRHEWYEEHQRLTREIGKARAAKRKTTTKEEYLAAKKKHQQAIDAFKAWKAANVVEMKMTEDGTMLTPAEAKARGLEDADLDTVEMPTRQWVNDKYTAIMNMPEGDIRRRIYEEVMRQTIDDDKSMRIGAKLVRRTRGLAPGAEFIRTPTVRATTQELIWRGDFADTIRSKVRAFVPWKIEVDEMDFHGHATETTATEDPDTGEITEESLNNLSPNENADNEDITFVLTDIGKNQKKWVPVYFRGELERTEERSFDVLGMTLLNGWMTSNKRHMEAAEPLAKMFMEVQVNRKQVQYDRNGKRMIDSIRRMYNKQNPDDQQVREEFLGRGGDTNTYDLMKSLVDSHLYGEKKIDNEKVAKVADGIASYASNLALMMNHYSITASLYQGTVLNWIETTAGLHLNRQGLLKGYSRYWKDFGNIVGDFGRSTPQSKVNLIMEYFDGYQNWSPFRYHHQNEVANEILNGNIAHSVRNGAESHMQATIAMGMLAGWRGYDKDGKVILNDKGEEADLYDLIDTSSGKVVLDERIATVTLSNAWQGRQIPVSEFHHTATQYIQSVFTHVQGNYSTVHREKAKRVWYGRMLMSMRGWLGPGFDYRFKGMSRKNLQGKKTTRDLFDPFMSTEREGSYTTFVRFVAGVIRDLKAERMMAVTKGLALMSPEERANMQRVLLDFATIALTLSAVYILKNLGDDDEEYADSGFIMYLAYLNRRLYSETATWNVMMPFEAAKVIGSPAVSVGSMTKVLKFSHQLLTAPFERYEQGARSGDSKLMKYFIDMIPGITPFNATAEDYLSWYSSMRFY